MGDMWLLRLEYVILVRQDGMGSNTAAQVLLGTNVAA